MKTKRIITAALVSVVLLLCSCSVERPENVTGRTDALGHTITVTSTQKAVACGSSLADLWQLSGGGLIGVTSDVYDENRIDVPENAITVGGARMPSIETIIGLEPELVLLSADNTGHTALYDTLNGAGVPTVYLSIETIDDYLYALDICTDITGHKELYETNGTAVKKMVDAVIAKTVGKPHPTVLYARAQSDDVKAKSSDTMTGKMLSDLGCINIADGSQALKADLSMEEIIRRDPDFIFITTMGNDTEKALASIENKLVSNPAWAELKAVKNGNYHILPKELFHYKPNAKWNESYEMLYEILYE